MKKLLSMIAVVVMVLAMSMTAFATTPDQNEGKITITNATKDEWYSVYRIFDATITEGTNGSSTGVAYKIKPGDQFFETLFGDGTKENKFFEYFSTSGLVKKKEGVNDKELTKYLEGLITDETTGYEQRKQAQNETVEFTDLPYGYYVIKRQGCSIVTIDSSAPTATVIDKNQTPGGGFNKQVLVGKDKDGKDIWADANTAEIGDVIKYKVSFEATNYDGEKKVQYYTIHDTKGDAIWVEFDSFEVKVNGEKLEKGYYLGYGDKTVNTGEWEFFGDWTEEEMDDPNCVNLADWYLVHIGYDEFKIVIPWLQNHELVAEFYTPEVTDETDPTQPIDGTEGNDKKVKSYSLKFNDDAAFRFTSPVNVEVTYTAAVEPNAAIGGNGSHNLYNTATGFWTTKDGTESTEPDTVVTNVYGLAIEKKDSATGKHLANAKFRIYSDEACTQNVYVIPTDIKGVYILDSKGKDASNVSGMHMATSRELYRAYLEGYLGTDYDNKQDNLVETPVNGKIVILGLKEGTYYLKEVEAPNGYNAYTQTIAVEVGKVIKPFIIYAKEEAAEGAFREVADLVEEKDGFVANTYQVAKTEVLNSTGDELPSTGGFGRTAIIACGSLVAIGFAILLITHKKMSIYTD